MKKKSSPIKNAAAAPSVEAATPAIVAATSATTEPDGAPERAGPSFLERETEAELALEEHQSQLEAMQPERMVAVNIDPVTAAMLVLALARRWAPYRARIAALSTEVNQELVDDVVSLAQATLHAYTRERLTHKSSPEVYEALKQGTSLRDTLVVEVEILVKRGLIDPAWLDQIERAPGYRNVAFALGTLGEMLKERWLAIQGKTAITEQDVEAAQQLAARMFEQAALRKEVPVEVVRARQLGAQAFSAMLRAYDEVRRCLEFLEPELFEDLAPSLYTKARKQSGRSEVETEPGVSTEPAPANGPALSAAPVPAGSPEAPSATSPTAPVGPGGLVLPSPFR